MKYCDNIGFSDKVEVRPTIWEDSNVEKKYFGDVISLGQDYNKTENVNDDVIISAQISIISDDYINHSISKIKYVTLMGSKWKVKNIKPVFPRLIITLGGIYNG